MSNSTPKVVIGSEDGAAEKPLWPQLPPAP